jgi:triosephosphate isomerase
MFKSGDEAVAFIGELVPKVSDWTDREVALAVPATALYQAAVAAKGTKLIIGAQNMYWEKEGAFTGEISSEMILKAGASLVLLGHSERRQYFGETDETVSKKLTAAIAAGLKPVVCVGENLQDREGGITFKVLAKQLTGSLAGLKTEQFVNLILAYEPVWAIGTGKTATTAQAQETQAFIREHLTKQVGAQAADEVRILYGGSVKPENAADLMSQNDIDGLLVGGASLKSDSFAGIVNFKK